MRPSTDTERMRQRAARIAKVASVARRISDVPDQPITYLVFANSTVANEVLQELGATVDARLGGVLLWDDTSATAIGTFEDANGLVAVGHAWTLSERQFLADYLSGWRAAAIRRDLPPEWTEPGSR